MTFLAFCLAYGGLCCLCLSAPKHYQTLIGSLPALWEARVFKAVGWAGQLLALGACWVSRGAAVGTVLYLGMLTVGGIALILMLAYRPRWPMYLASMGTALGLFLLPFTH
ncbi:DUF3325 domain-containing protein [Pseudomonas sp. Marseille-QA0892]